MTFSDLVVKLVSVVNSLIAVVTAGAFLFFLWGVFTFIRSESGDTNAKKVGYNMIMQGIIALVVLVSFGGIVNILAKSVFGDLGPGSTSATFTTNSGGGSLSDTGGTSGSVASSCTPKELSIFGNVTSPNIFGYCLW